jgi:hypothetical protein
MASTAALSSAHTACGSRNTALILSCRRVGKPTGTDSLSGPAPNTVDGIPGDASGNLDCNSYALSKSSSRRSGRRSRLQLQPPQRGGEVAFLHRGGR